MNVACKSSDYTYMWWAHGWRGASPDGERILCMESGNYGLSFNVDNLMLKHIGVFGECISSIAALCEDSDRVFSLPQMDLEWNIKTDISEYSARNADSEDQELKTIESLMLPFSLAKGNKQKESTRIIESGRFLQRCDLERIYFQDEDDARLRVSGRLEISLIPDFASIILEVICRRIGSANVEISPPPTNKYLLPGDYVECEVELIVLPVCAEDYYGPNAELRKNLEIDGNSWRTTFRQAVGNFIEVNVQSGKLLSFYPLVLNIDKENTIEFSIKGGIGYLPITFIGLSDYKGWILMQMTELGWEKMDQSIYGKNYWQTDYDTDTGLWSITYNILMDHPDKKSNIICFQFYKEFQSL